MLYIFCPPKKNSLVYRSEKGSLEESQGKIIPK